MGMNYEQEPKFGDCNPLADICAQGVIIAGLASQVDDVGEVSSGEHGTQEPYLGACLFSIGAHQLLAFSGNSKQVCCFHLSTPSFPLCLGHVPQLIEVMGRAWGPWRRPRPPHGLRMPHPGSPRAGHVRSEHLVLHH